jgi:hypothetical protein
MPKRGPKTPAGKKAVRLNAVRHGLFSHDVVIPGIESPEEWQQYRATLIAGLDPEGAPETLLAERVAAIAWQQRRIARYEAQIIAVGIEQVEQDYARMMAYGSSPSLQEAEAAAETTGAAARMIRDLLAQPADALLPAPVCIEVMDAATEDDGANAEALQQAGDRPWPAGTLTRALERIAEERNTPLPRFLDELRDRLDDRLRRRVADLDGARMAVQRMRRQRLLPDDRTLHKIVRVDAHLDRAFYRALHELESLQTRRRGEPPSVARLQVHGLPGG